MPSRARRLGDSFWRPGWGAVAACAVFLVFAAFGLQALDGLLKGMHPPGRSAYSFSSLSAGPDQTADVLDVWSKYAERVTKRGTGEAAPPASPRHVVWWYAWTDTLAFGLAFALLLFLFFRRAYLDYSPGSRRITRLRKQLQERGVEATSATARYRAFARFGALLAVCGLLSDWTENWLSYYLVRDGFDDGLRTSLRVMTWLKFAFFGLACFFVLLLALALIRDAGEGRFAALRRDLHRLRAVLLVVALFGFVILGVAGPVGEQIPDLIRRWTILQLAIAVVLATFLALALWALAGVLLGLKRPDPQDSTVRVVVGAVLVLMAAGQGVAWLVRLVDGGDFHPGWGLAFPAALVLVLLFFGWLLPSRGTETEGPPPQPERPPTPAPDGPRTPRLPRLLAAAIPLLLGLGVLKASFGFAVYAGQWSWLPLAPAGGALAATIVALWLRQRYRLPAWLTEPLVLGTIGAAIGFAGIARSIGTEELQVSLQFATAILLGVGALRLYAALDKVEQLRWKTFWLPSSLVLLGLVAVWVIMIVNVGHLFDLAEVLGGIGVVALFCALATYAAALATWVGDGVSPPKLLVALHFKRIPVLLILLVWIALVVNWGRDYHAVRFLADQPAAVGITVRQAFNCWLQKNALEPFGNAEDECPSVEKVTAHADGESPGQAVPFIFVATTGGGIRAAYWTGLVLDCVFELAGSRKPDEPCARERRLEDFVRSDKIFAASGISGGSLGLASYAAYLTEKKAEDGKADPVWVTHRLNDDAVSASAAWWFFAEIPRAFIGFNPPIDRAGVLEKGWEREWNGTSGGGLRQGLFGLLRDHPEAPFLLLNGTSAEDGCRFNTSVLDANIEAVATEATPGKRPEIKSPLPRDCRSTTAFDRQRLETDPRARFLPDLKKSVLAATRDLADFLCGTPNDVSLSTAALLSARFPFVSPAGRLKRQCEATGLQKTTSVVDGGYLDTSGASPVLELMTAVRPLILEYNDAHQENCLVPFLIQIDNGFDNAAAPNRESRPNELILPATTLQSTRIARAAEARALAALAFTEPFPRVRLKGAASVGFSTRYVHFINEAHPGPQAPLGWTQSHVSMNELETQRLARQNIEALRDVRRLFRLTRPDVPESAPHLACS